LKTRRRPGAVAASAEASEEFFSGAFQNLITQKAQAMAYVASPHPQSLA
jgi:hypothetical protein